MDARRILTSLQRAGMTVMRVNNSFTREGTGYAGLNVNVRTRVEGEDADWEIQFHTRDSLKAKEKGHRTYERLRQLSPDAVPRGTLEEDLRDAAARVAPPQGIEMILSFDLYAEPSIADERPGGPMNQLYRGAAADQARSSDLDTGQPYGPHGATRSAPAVTHPAPDPGHAVRSNWGPRPPRAPDVLSGLHDPPWRVPRRLRCPFPHPWANSIRGPCSSVLNSFWRNQTLRWGSPAGCRIIAC
ncbi:hypothetical protein KAF44_30645 (plasmid) [Cupriavidus necator]|nr:hypothetical protein KAF44_30645 [Cupriavidus necator]